MPLWALQRYVRTEKVSAQVESILYCDAAAMTFNLLHMNFVFDSRSTFSSIHAKTSVLQATWNGFLEGLQTGPQGDMRQQGGAFVLAPSSREDIAGSRDEGALEQPLSSADIAFTCIWAHYDRHNADQVQIPALLMAAGLPHTVYRNSRL